MKNRLPRVSVGILVVTLLLIAGSKTAAQVKQTVDIKTLTLGVVYQSAPERVAERFRPLVEYTARKLAPTGEIKSTVKVAANTAQLIELLEQGQVDFYLESPFPLISSTVPALAGYSSDVGKAAWASIALSFSRAKQAASLVSESYAAR